MRRFRLCRHRLLSLAGRLPTNMERQTALARGVLTVLGRVSPISVPPHGSHRTDAPAHASALPPRNEEICPLYNNIYPHNAVVKTPLPKEGHTGEAVHPPKRGWGG